MITCRELVELLLDFVSGEMPPDHRDRVEKHLCRCPPCVAYLQTYQLTIRLTRQLPPAPLPAGLVKSLQAALEELRKGRGCEGGASPA
jgi:anti-sigma factor RsiW